MRMTQQSAGDFSSLVGSTAFDDIERHTFKTEELEILPVEWNGLATDPDLTPVRPVRRGLKLGVVYRTNGVASSTRGDGEVAAFGRPRCATRRCIR